MQPAPYPGMTCMVTLSNTLAEVNHHAMQNHPAAFKFSLCTEYGKKRSFQLSWLKNHKCLVYSPKEDGACHRECALFGTASLKNSDEIDELVKSPIFCWTVLAKNSYAHFEC